MNIREAVESGRPFKRAGTAKWLDGMLVSLRHLPCGPFTFADLVADDWEVQEATVTITRTQLLEAFGQACCALPYEIVAPTLAICLAQVLGLGSKT